jgi:hypothetical protein
MRSSVDKEARPDSGSAWASVKAVGAAFVGLRRRQDLEADSVRIHPVHVLIAGFIAVFVFVAVLIGVVNWVVAR